MMSSYSHQGSIICVCHSARSRRLRKLMVLRTTKRFVLSVYLTMKYITLVFLSNRQEIGSLTSHGADSNFLPTVLSRLSSLPASNSDRASATAFEESLSKSFLISA